MPTKLPLSFQTANENNRTGFTILQSVVKINKPTTVFAEHKTKGYQKLIRLL